MYGARKFFAQARVIAVLLFGDPRIEEEQRTDERSKGKDERSRERRSKDQDGERAAQQQGGERLWICFRITFGKRILEALDEAFDRSYLQQFVRERLERRDAIAQEMLHSRGIGAGEKCPLLIHDENAERSLRSRVRANLQRRTQQRTLCRR